MSFKKIVTYSTILTVSFTMSLIVDALSNKASAVISDRCLQTVYKVHMGMNQSKAKDGSGGVTSFPLQTYIHPIDKYNEWANAPTGYVISFSQKDDISIDYRKTSAKIINSCKETVGVKFSLYNGETNFTYGIIKGKLVRFEESGCFYDNSTVKGSFNRYRKLNWGYNSILCPSD